MLARYQSRQWRGIKALASMGSDPAAAKVWCMSHGVTSFSLRT